MSKQNTRKIGWSADAAHMMEGLVGKTKKQLRAEAVERLKEARYHSASDHLCAMLGWGHEPHTGEEAHEALIDLLTDDDGEDISDTREQLEADINKWWEEEYPRDFYTNEDIVRVVGRWLNRQAAITRKECERPNWDYCETCDALAELTAERDELQAAIDAMNNGQFYGMYEAKCEECKEAVSFAKRVENAVNDGQPVTLFGVDYFTAKQNKKLLAEHEQLLKKLKRLRRRLAKAKKERDYLQKVVKTQAESFKKLECELAGKDG